jgi:transposase
VKKRVYVDESGIEKDLIREYGYALKGQKIEDVRRGRKFRRTNIVAGLCCNKVIAPLCYTHSTTGDFFESWFKNSLLKKVKKGYTIIMDNASFHRKKALKKLVRNTGIKLLYLSPYSPDFNPIETKWANMKRALVDLLPKNKTAENAIYQYFSV